jgi:hypothetical protein
LAKKPDHIISNSYMSVGYSYNVSLIFRIFSKGITRRDVII